MKHGRNAGGSRTYGALPLFFLGLVIPGIAVALHFTAGRGLIGLLALPSAAIASLPHAGMAESLRGSLSHLSSGAAGVSGASQTQIPERAAAEQTPLPTGLRMKIVDAETGAPVDAHVFTEAAQVRREGSSEYFVSSLSTGSVVSVAARGYVATRLPYGGEESLEVRLKPSYVGVVRDEQSGRPLGGARVIADGEIVTVDEDGYFLLPDRPSSGRISVLKPGYLREDVTIGPGASLDVTMQPHVARGLYLTLFAAAHDGLRDHVIRLLDQTEANSVVVDVKGDRGWILYRSQVPLADKIGANDVNPVPGIEDFLASMKRRNVYTIARIVVFKDDLLAHNGPRAGVDVAIKNAASGGVWIDGEDLGWVDPFREQAWDYNIALAREAARKGFDEIQFDYIRFPTDPSAGNAVDNAVYSQTATEESRVRALSRFLQRARDAVNSEGAYLSIDTFGYTCWADGDMGIGQDLRQLGKYVDYVSPMVYPSTFSAGLPGLLKYPAVVSEPYDVIYESMKQAEARLHGTGSVLRPWLQYFDDYPWATGFAYNAPQVVAQKRAVLDSGATGWLFWDPANTYDRGGFDPE